MPTSLSARSPLRARACLLALSALGFLALARVGGLRLAAPSRPSGRRGGCRHPAVRRRPRASRSRRASGAWRRALAVDLAGVADPSAYGPSLSFKLFVAVLIGGAASALGGPAGIALLGLVSVVATAAARFFRQLAAASRR